MSTNGDTRQRQHDGPPPLPIQAHSVRMDVQSDFAADAATTTTHKVLAAVESEFKTRSEKGKHFHVVADVGTAWTADS